MTNHEIFSTLVWYSLGIIVCTWLMAGQHYPVTLSSFISPNKEKVIATVLMSICLTFILLSI